MPKRTMLEIARYYYDMGWGIHWIKPNSKAPVKTGWSSPTRDDWSIVSKDFRKEYGLGVRMGDASNLGGAYLANIDVDLKSPLQSHQDEALEFLEATFPGLFDSAPCVKTGYGYRLFVKTEKPLRSGKLSASGETTKVLMPTAEINQQQLNAVRDGKLTQEELDSGWRIRGAWEVEFMSIGKQVVLPPTIHPDTKVPYKWLRPVKGIDGIPLIRLDGLERSRTRGRPIGAQTLNDFEPVAVDLVSSPLSDKIVNMILTGEGVSDRSAAAFSVSMAMLKAKFTEIEILSVLTDRETFLGEIGYDHRKTESRKAAAAWVSDYCIKKAREEISASKAFEDEIEEFAILDEAGVKAQASELQSTDWRTLISRGGQNGEGAPKQRKLPMIKTRRPSNIMGLRP